MNLSSLSNQPAPASGGTQTSSARSVGIQRRDAGFGDMLAMMMKKPEPTQAAGPSTSARQNQTASDAGESVAKRLNSPRKVQASAGGKLNMEAVQTEPGAATTTEATASVMNEAATPIGEKSADGGRKREDSAQDQESATDTGQSGLLALVAMCAPVALTQAAPIVLPQKVTGGGAQGQSAECQTASLTGEQTLTAGAVVPLQPELPGYPVGSERNDLRNLSATAKPAPVDPARNPFLEAVDSTSKLTPSTSLTEAVAPNFKPTDTPVPAVSTAENQVSKSDVSALNVQDSAATKPLAADAVAVAGAAEPTRISAQSRKGRAEVTPFPVERSGEYHTGGAVGTGTAPHIRQMQSEQQQNEFADHAKQNLPEKLEQTPAPAEAAGMVEKRAVEAQSVATAGIQNAESVIQDLTEGKSGTSTPSGIHPSVERLVGGISHETMILRQFKPDKLDVVIRPDADTQISLQLRMSGNDVQGVARCERGDFNLLNSHWGELQKAMDQQGVRLSSLRESGSPMSFSGGGAFGNSSQMGQEQRGRRLEEIVVSEKESASRPVGASATAGRSSRSVTGKSLLHTWA